MKAEIITYPGKKEKNRNIQSAREKRRKKDTKYERAITYPVQDDGGKGIKSGKRDPACRFI